MKSDCRARLKPPITASVATPTTGISSSVGGEPATPSVPSVPDPSTPISMLSTPLPTPAEKKKVQKVNDMHLSFVASFSSFHEYAFKWLSVLCLQSSKSSSKRSKKTKVRVLIWLQYNPFAYVLWELWNNISEWTLHSLAVLEFSCLFAGHSLLLQPPPKTWVDGSLKMTLPWLMQFNKHAISPLSTWESNSLASLPWRRFRNAGMLCCMTPSFPSESSMLLLPTLDNILHIIYLSLTLTSWVALSG